MKKIFLIIFLGSLLFPLVSLAGTYMACHDTVIRNGRCDPGETYTTVYYDGLVPCGKGYCVGDSLDIREIERRLTEEGQSLQNACDASVGGEYKTRALAGTDIEVGFPCTFCHFFVMLDGIIDFVLFQLVPVIAVLMLVIAGVMYVGAIFELIPGGWETFSRAKKIFTSIAIGLVIIYGSWLIINEFFLVIKVADWTGLQTGWFSIKCPIALPPT